MLSPSMHYGGNRLETRRSTCPSRSPLPTRSTSIYKLTESQHFHYEYVELGPVNVELVTGETELLHETTFDATTFLWGFLIESNDRKWMIHRTFPEFMEFDCQLHRCVFDRRHSRLTELRQLSLSSTMPLPSPTTPTTSTVIIGNEPPPSPTCSSSASTNATTTTAALSWAVSSPIKIRCHLSAYVERLSQLTGSIITCFPVLKFLELDSRGNHFIPIEHSQINTPAVAAAIVIQNFIATKSDELSIKVGDIVSVIEMKSVEQADNIFWKGKLTICKDGQTGYRGSRVSLPVIEEPMPKNHRFAMGFFPSSYVKVLNNKAESISMSDQYPSHFSHGFSRRSFVNRKSMWRTRPKILRQSFWTAPRNNKAVFGTDLTMHLARTNTDIPIVVTKCIDVIESHGLITGIYRQCGIQSNIARLRYEFDHGNLPNLTDSKILRDIHCVSSLLKTYFRQLPNPLFTYELYADILAAYESEPKDRIKNIRQIVRRLPPAHYRTARALMYHLSRMCRHKNMTDMNASNLSIVWAPNLFRVPTTDEDNNIDGQLLRGITIHKSLCNFFIVYAHVLFSIEDYGSTKEESFTKNDEDLIAEMDNYLKCKEEMSKNVSILPYIDVNGGPAMLPTFHTVIDRPIGKEDSPKWKKLFRYSSLENTITGFFNKRRSAKSSISTQHTLTDIGMNTSVTSEGGNMRRSSSMLTNVTKNVEELGQNMIRHVRNLSLRRSRRDAKTNPIYCQSGDMHASVESTSAIEEFDIIKSSPSKLQEAHALRMSQTSEGNALLNGSESYHSKSAVADNNNFLTIKNSEKATDDKILEKTDAKQKRVMFESSSRAEQFFYADDHTDDNSDEEDEDKYGTDISSAESLPLDVSRYDNVVPHKK